MNATAICFYLDIAALPKLDSLQLEMPAKRRAALDSLIRLEDRRRCKAGWLLLSRALGAGAWRLCYGRYGKPFLPGGPYFSLAHAGNYAILAVARSPVGADVEAQSPRADCAALAAVALHPQERAFFAQNPDARTFYDLWTLKESYLKLLGAGLGKDPVSFALSQSGGEWRLPAKPEFRFCLYDQLRGYSAALCLYGCAPPPKLTPLEF